MLHKLRGFNIFTISSGQLKSAMSLGSSTSRGFLAVSMDSFSTESSHIRRTACSEDEEMRVSGRYEEKERGETEKKRGERRHRGTKRRDREEIMMRGDHYYHR